MANKKAIVFGCNGQDGYFACQMLSKKDYDVCGVSKHLTKKEIHKLIHSSNPNEIYNFAGYSNTFDPYADLDKMIESNLILPKNILESINPDIKFFHASSCLVFGKTQSILQNELTPTNPIHPYGVIKLAAQNLVKMFREDKGLFACSGIFFPHESHRRGEGFFTKKIIDAVVRIKKGSEEKIKIGAFDQIRDWGWASEYVDASYLMLQHHTPIDFVIGSGNVSSLNSFISEAFKQVGLNWLEHTEVDNSITRKNDFSLRSDISKIKIELGWSPKYNVSEIIKKMIYAKTV